MSHLRLIVSPPPPPTAGQLIDRGLDRDVAALLAALEGWRAIADAWARRSRPYEAGEATMRAIDLLDLLRRAEKRTA